MPSGDKYWLKPALLGCGVLFVLMELGLRLAGSAYAYARQRAQEKVSSGTGYTVMTLGDSFTFGGNVSVWNNYPYALAGLLRENPAFKNSRVVNRGRCEFNSRQVVQEFREQVDAVRPDVVVLLAGSSDKWNLSGWDKATPLFLSNWKENARQDQMPYASFEELAYAANDYGFSSSGGWFGNTVGRLRVVRTLLYLKINLEVKYLLWRAGKENWTGEKLAALSRTADLETTERLADYLAIRSRYDLIFDTAVSMLAAPGAEHSEYIRSKVFFQWLAWAHSFQKRYDASVLESKMETLLSRSPALAGNEVFMKYLRLFRDREHLDFIIEDIMRSNMKEIILECRRRGIRVVLQTYPGSYDSVNGVIAAVAAEESVPLVDNKAIFDGLSARGGREKLLAGDDHCTAEGYRVMARNVYGTLVTDAKAR